MPRGVGFNQDNVTKKGRFMKQQLLRTIVACAAGLALGTQAQTSSSSGGTSTDPSSSYPSSSTTSPSSSGSYGSSSSSQSGWGSHRLRATGRMGHEVLRGSQLTGAEVKGTTGSQVGTISDTIINPVSGRLEFAVISVNDNGSSISSTPASSGATGISSASSSAGGKQVAVPWMLLRSSSAGASSSATSSSGANMQQPSFTFAGDTSKLESAPSFDANTDLTQPSWRQSVFSYFGLSGNSSATGAAETPGSSSTGSSDTSGSSDSSSSGSTPPHNK